MIVSEALKSATLQHTESHCITLHHTATHGNSLQLTATHCITLQLTATQGHISKARSTALNKLGAQMINTATHCNALHFATTHCNSLQQQLQRKKRGAKRLNQRHCNFLQLPAIICNSLQLTATQGPISNAKSAAHNKQSTYIGIILNI